MSQRKIRIKTSNNFKNQDNRYYVKKSILDVDIDSFIKKTKSKKAKNKIIKKNDENLQTNEDNFTNALLTTKPTETIFSTNDGINKEISGSNIKIISNNKLKEQSLSNVSQRILSSKKNNKNNDNEDKRKPTNISTTRSYISNPLNTSTTELSNDKDFRIVQNKIKEENYFLPPQIRKLLKFQSLNLKEEFRSKDEFYCLVDYNEKQNISSGLKLSGINYKTFFTERETHVKNREILDKKKYFKKEEIKNENDTKKIFRLGFEEYKPKKDSFLNKQYFFEGKNNIPKHIKTEKKLNYLSEIYNKTSNWIDKQYNPISISMKKLNSKHLASVKNESSLRFAQQFSVADTNKFETRFRVCNIVDDNYITNITQNMKNLNKILNDRESIEREIKNRIIRIEKMDKWKHSIITAAFQFKNLGMSLIEFYSSKFFYDKPYYYPEFVYFIQAVKDNNELEVLRFLISNRLLVYDTDEFKQTALHWASKRNFSNIVSLLIKYGSFVDTKDEFGNSPLHIACRYNHLEIVIILLKNYANPLSQDKFGKTPSQITKNDVIIYYLKRVKVLYILYKNISIQSFYEKVKCGVDYVFAHEMVRIGKEKTLKIKKD